MSGASLLSSKASKLEKLAKLDFILAGLMRRYRERVPAVGRVLNLMQQHEMIAAEDQIENDHIAFRTIAAPLLGIRSIDAIFLDCGYEKRDSYHFPAKKIDAFWYAPPRDDYPRIFISELRIQDLSEQAQRIIRSYTDEVTQDPLEAVDFQRPESCDDYLHRGLWRVPTWEDYQTLAEESEYASWAIYNRYYLNHFTVSVHNLPAPYNTIEAFNTFLESHGIVLNDSGGKAKTSPDGLLIQSSTVAEMVEAEFKSSQGNITQHIAGSYVEFAERRVLPEFSQLPQSEISRVHRRDGFEASNADKIFESTFSSQTSNTHSPESQK